METQQKTRRLEYKWVIIAAAFLMVFTCLGFCSSNKGLYLSAITEALGLSRSLFSLNDSCRYITTSVVNLFFGLLISKFGARKMIGAGFLSLIASVLIYAHAENIFVFYLGGCFLGMGLSWTTTTMVGYVVDCWCKEHKGTIMGLVLCANGLGGALAAQIVTPLIYEAGNPFGYRNAYQLVALILLIVGALVVILFRDAPKEIAANLPKKKAKGQSIRSITFREAIRKPYFYVAAICIFFTGSALQGVNGISAAHMTDSGLDAGYVATVLSVHSLALAGSKFLTGLAYDKIGLKKTMLICNGAAVAAFLMLSFVSPEGPGKILAMGYGVFSSFALPLETVMIPLIVTELFGSVSFAKLLGIYVSVNTAGFAIGTPIANLVFDLCGTYFPFLLALAAMMLVVCAVFQTLLVRIDRENKALAAQRENA
ncbi:MAG: MFS transporter [Clostridia bacterium]|nr:MFS transporter [Clostridia bacterium]